MKTPTATRRERPAQPTPALSTPTELIQIRVTPSIKAWIDSRGGSEFHRKLLEYAKAMEDE